jgi:nucleotidyltransferase/DNA polymerase involved in DNA repair
VDSFFCNVHIPYGILTIGDIAKARPEFLKTLLGVNGIMLWRFAKGKKSNAVVTKFTLKKATNNNGIAYSQAQFSVDRALTDEEYALICGLTEQVKAFSLRVGYDTESTVDVPANVDPATGEIIEPLA